VAVYTHLRPEEIAAFLEHFGLPGPTAFQGVPAGSINTNYFVESAGERYFLRYNEVASPEELRYEAALLQHLEARGTATPALRWTRSGTPFAPLRERRGSLFRYAQGEERTSRSASPADLREVGRALSALHRAGRDFPERRPHAFEFDSVSRWVREIAALDEPSLRDTVPLLTEEIAYLRAARDPTLPRGVIHGDLFPDNVKFDSQGAVSLLFDFEMASDGVLVYDVAVCLSSWCYEGAFDFERARAFCAGYEEGRPFTAPERAGLYAEMRMSALRFTVTRIRDFHLRPVPAGDRVEKSFRDFLRRLLDLRAMGPPGFTGRLWPSR
jgi:homoserine kinase type II